MTPAQRKALELAIEALAETIALCENYYAVEDKDGYRFTEAPAVIKMGYETIADLSSQLAAPDDIAKDAERYRWLRGEVQGPHLPLAQVVWKLNNIRDSHKWTNLVDGATLDEHIDAAMQTEKDKP